MNLAPLFRRFDAIAHEQLCAEVVRLGAEIEQLREELYWAQRSAESWQEDALRFQEDLIKQNGGSPGLTMSGALVVVPMSKEDQAREAAYRG